jgi:DNA-directed RNA polymerase
LREKIELLFKRMYYVSKLPGVSSNVLSEIHNIVSCLEKRLDPGTLTVSVYSRKKGMVNKPANASQIRGKIMSSVTSLSNHYLEILNGFISQRMKSVNSSVLNAFNSIIKPLEKNLISLHEEVFQYQFSGVKNKTNTASYILDMDQTLQNEVLNHIISQPLTVANEMNNVLSQIGAGDVSSSRVDALAFQTPFSDGVVKILNTKFLRDVDKQYLIEKFALEYELNFLKYHLDKQSSKALMILFRENHSKLIKALNLLIGRYSKNNFEYLKKIGPTTEAKIAVLLILFDREKLASIIFSSIVKLLSKTHSEPMVKSALSMEIAEQVLRAFNYIEKNPYPTQLLGVFPEFEDLKALRTMEPIEKAQLGLALVESVLVKLPIISAKTVTVDKKSSTFVEFHPDYISLLSKEGMDPMILPMVCPPLEWGPNGRIGGYLTSAVRFYNNKDLDIIHQNTFNMFDSEPSEIQYTAINHLNKQAFVINKDVLNFVLSEWEKENGLFGVYNKEHPLTGENISPISKKYKEVQTHNSLFWTYRNIINMALIFKDVKFYLPTFMDFRGRIYPYVSYLSYQGNDLARALLNFADSEPITAKGFEYMQLYLASTYGHSSLTFEERLAWFDDNFDKFL